MIETIIEIGGVQYPRNTQCVVTRTAGNFNTASTAEIHIKNDFGIVGDSIDAGQEVKIWVSEDVTPDTGVDTPVFGGYVDMPDWTGDDHNKEKIMVSARDYSMLLQDNNVEPIRYTNQQVEDIIDDIITQSGLDITTNLVTTGVTIDVITFNQIPIFDAVKELARRAGCIFYVDSNKVLQLVFEGSTTNGLTFSSASNIKTASFKKSRRELFNKVWVYGGEYLSGFKYSTTADGGSVYSLPYKPHNTNVAIGAGDPYIGGIFNQQAEGADPGSPYQYLVDFNGARIIFVSGTEAGNHLPTSGTDTINVNADRSEQIQEFGRDLESIDLYKPKTKVINDRNIKDPRVAQELVYETLNQYSRPFREGSANLIGHFELVPGYFETFNVPNHGVNNEELTILEVKYTINPTTSKDKTHITVKCDKKIIDGADTIKEMLLKIRRQEQANFDTDQVLGRSEFFFPSGAARTLLWEVQTASVGSSFILDSPEYGRLNGTGGTQTYLDSSLGAWTTQYSGSDA